MNENLTELDQALLKAYCDILENDNDFEFIKKSKHSELSVIFLPGVSKNYCAAKNKIMIIGRETATEFRQKECWKPDVPLVSYIEKWMLARSKHLSKQLCGKNSRGFTYFNLLRQIAKHVESDGVIWSNLFCYDWKGGSIKKSPLEKSIKNISTKLLKKQIDILRPENIIFAHGCSGGNPRKESEKIFPLQNRENIIVDEFDGSKNLSHFKFKWDDEYIINCYQLRHHPAVRSKEAQVARNLLFKYINLVI